MSGTWVMTFTGRHFDLLNPTPDMVCIEDIAHALANICRFAGHTKNHYSVAQHSVHVSELVPPEEALAALMHDAGEAYYGDITRPMKTILREMTIRGRTTKWYVFDVFSAKIDSAIDEALGIPPHDTKAIHNADDVMLMTERRDLMAESSESWSVHAKPAPFTIRPWDHKESEIQFLVRYHLLKEKK